MSNIPGRDEEALALIARERFGEALRLLGRTPDTQSDTADTLALRAEALARIAEFDKAELAARAALSLNPHSARAIYVLGIIADSRDQKQAAVNLFGRALHEEPGFAPAHYAAGLILMATGQVDAAARHFAEAQSIDPARWRFAAAASLALPPRERYQGLRSAYRRGLEDHPTSLRLRLRYFTTYLMAPFANMLPDHARADPRVSAATMAHILQRVPILTYALLAANIAVFGWIETHGGSSNVVVLDRSGAEDPTLIVHQGEWWRLVTPLFLHAGITHLSVNAMSLYFVGTLYERFVGKARFLLVYFAAGVGGSIVSLAALPELGVGASGAIFGIFAGLGAFAFSNRHVLGVISGRLLRSVVGLSVLNLLTPLLDPHIDGWAHAGGLLTGIIAGLLAGPLLVIASNAGGTQSVLNDRVSTRIRLLMGSALVLTLVCLAWATIRINPAGV